MNIKVLSKVLKYGEITQVFTYGLTAGVFG